MFTVNKDDKKTIIPFLSKHPEEVKTFYPFPIGPRFDLPPSLKNYIKEMDKKYENIYQKEDKGVFINLIKEDIDDNTFASYSLMEDYWKTSPYLDLIYDYISLKETYASDKISRGEGETLSIYDKLLEYLRDSILSSLGMKGKEETYKRYQIKPGKLLKKLFPDATAQECEEFQQKWLSIYAQYGWKAILETEDVKKYYFVENYYEKEGPLGASCMRSDDSQIALTFYENNNVRLAIYKEPDTDKIRARALLWDVLISPEHQEKYNLPEEVTYMDRIYFIKERDKLTMLKFAEKNNYLYRDTQSAGIQNVVLPSGDKVLSAYLHMIYPLECPHGTLPFRDTFNTIVNYNGKVCLTSIEDSSNYPKGMERRGDLPHIREIYDSHKNRFIPAPRVRSCTSCYRIYDASEDEEVDYHDNEKCLDEEVM